MRTNSLLWGARDLSDRSGINHRSRSIRAKKLRATNGRKPASYTASDVHAQPQWSAITSDHSPPAHTTPARIAREPTDTGEHEQQGDPAYRERPTQLSAPPNACLARAADAWRRGDVQLAKRFTREGHKLNAKMRSEGREGGRRAVLEWVEGFREEFDAVAANDHRTAAPPMSDTDEWALGEAVANGQGCALGERLVAMWKFISI